MQTEAEKKERKSTRNKQYYATNKKKVLKQQIGYVKAKKHRVFLPANERKWTWKNGRLHHPTERFSIGIDDAYCMQERNDDIADACENVLEAYSVNKHANIRMILGELKNE